MKTYTLLFICLLYSMSVFAQKPSCCSAPASQQFMAMAEQSSFIAAHESPLAFNYESKRGKMITFTTSDGKTANGYEVKSAKPTNNIVLMFHEWWGLNDYIKQEAEKLQAELGNATVIAIDMYDGKVTADAKEASKLVQSLTDERAAAIISGVVKYAGSNARIATIGWCFGGGMSLQASIEAGKQGIACVMYYGMPENNLEKLKNLQAPVLGIFATQDKFITADLVMKFAANMSSLHKKITIKNYNADHAFANPSNPHHDAKASEDAHKNALIFLKSVIK